MHDEATPLTPSERFIVLFSVFFGGAILMGLEILGFRIIGKTFGSALRETSVVISVFMGAMSVGYFGGGRLADRLPRIQTFIAALILAAFSALPVPIIDALIADRVFESTVPIWLHSTIVSVVLFFLPTMCLASLSPIAIRILTRGIEKTGKAAGTTSAISTVGSILGSIATAFVLIDFFRSTQRTVIVLALGALLLAALTSFVSALSAAQRGGRAATAKGALVAALALALTVVSMKSGPLIAPAARAGSSIVFEQDSAFHHIVIEERANVRRLLFDRSAQSAMSLIDEYEGGFEYTDFFHIPMAIRPEAKRVLFLGLGGGTGPKRFLRDYPDATIEVVDIDALVIDVAHEYFGLPESDRLTIAQEDARAYLKRSSEQYDLVVIDTYTTNRYGSAVPAHLTTQEFFAEVSAKLNDGGVIVFNCAAPTTHPVTQAIAKTIRTVFPYHTTFSSTWGGNTELMASTSAFPIDDDAFVNAVQEAFDSERINMQRLVNRAGQLREYRLPIEVIALTDDFAPVDTLSLSTKSRAEEELPHSDPGQ